MNTKKRTPILSKSLSVDDINSSLGISEQECRPMQFSRYATRIITIIQSESIGQQFLQAEP